MEILGVGLPEIGFIVLLALILLGPKDMIKAGRTIGRSLRQFVMSPTWQAMRTTGKELQQLPTRLMREAGLEELQEMEKEVRKETDKNLSAIRSAEREIFSGPLVPPPSAGPAAPPASAPQPEPDADASKPSKKHKGKQ